MKIKKKYDFISLVLDSYCYYQSEFQVCLNDIILFAKILPEND